MTIVNGQVLDPYGRPVSDASIYIVAAPVPMPDIAQLADEQGRFILSAPVPGRYTVGVRSERWGIHQETFEVSGEGVLAIEIRFISTRV